MFFACAHTVSTTRLFLFYEKILKNKKRGKQTIGYSLTH